MRAWVSLGSNVGDGRAQIEAAVREIAALGGVQPLRQSRLYRTAPVGVEDQADFTNAVLEIETQLTAVELLRALLGIEEGMGRRRDERRWGPRLIDLDLLCHGDTQVESGCLTLPHPRMHQRAFVLVPLIELEPGFVIPGLGPARDWLERAAGQCVEQID